MIKIMVPEVDISIPVRNIHLLPKESAGLYLFYNAKGELMYIGKTKDLRNRLNIHIQSDKGTEDVRHNFSRVDCIFVQNEVERDLYETHMINTLFPPLNVEKVFTYKTRRYSPMYNKRVYEEMDPEEQKEFDRERQWDVINCL